MLLSELTTKERVMRQIVDINGLEKLLPLTVHQIRHKLRDPRHPIPHKKCGKRILFDVERVYKWFDQLPGVDKTVGFCCEWSF